MPTLPSAMEIQAMLSDLYGYQVEVKESAQDIDAKKAVHATFSGDDGSPVVLCVGDLSFANKSGAALTLVPPGMTEDNIRMNKLPDDILENYNEVLNVMCGLLNKQLSVHLKLNKVYLPGQDLPEEIRTIAAESSKSLKYEVAFRNYGAGCVNLIKNAVLTK